MRKLKQLILLKNGVFVKKITVLCTVAILDGFFEQPTPKYIMLTGKIILINLEKC